MPRLFLAAWPPAEIRDRLAEFDRTNEPDIRPVRPSNLHVTLRFIGDRSIDEVSDHLAGVRLPRTTAVLGDRIIRLGARQLVVPVEGVDALAAATRAATHGMGRRDEFEFFGHLTVARTTPNASSILLGVPVSGSFPIDEIALVESRLLPGGAEYETVATFPTAP